MIARTNLNQYLDEGFEITNLQIPFERLLFDFDGVLIDSAEGSERAWFNWSLEFGEDPLLSPNVSVLNANQVSGQDCDELLSSQRASIGSLITRLANSTR
jgi:phosphoglycolate phosphatase-like HAD superfamily hydrolase